MDDMKVNGEKIRKELRQFLRLIVTSFIVSSLIVEQALASPLIRDAEIEHTLRMYAERKQWPLTGVSLDLRYVRDGERSWIDRRIVLKGDLDEAQRIRFAEIAERTPVTLTLKSGLEIKTELRDS